MTTPSTLTLVNPQNGNLAFKVFSFADNGAFDHVQRVNYYSLIWIKEGRGKLRSDFSEYDFDGSVLLAFSPYQPYMIGSEDEAFSGVAIQFHPDFFCIHQHQKEVACNGVLFNNIYQPPFTTVDGPTAQNLGLIIGQIVEEMKRPALAQYELLISYLKILLITASRSRTEQLPQSDEPAIKGKQPFVLQSLKDAIETSYRTKHSAGEYADLLCISPKALGKIAKGHFNKTLTALITERIIIEAKRELYLTAKPIKEIAFGLGYSDEYYFSRLFKVATSISPQLYRQTVGFDAASRALRLPRRLVDDRGLRTVSPITKTGRRRADS